MTSPSSFRPRARSRLAALALLLSAAWAATGCSSPATEPDEPPATSSVTLTITVDESSGEALPSGPSALALRPGTGSVSALGFSFTDVTSIRVDVRDAVTTNPYFINFDLVPTAQGWSGLLPSLPQNRSLTFIARAHNAGGTLLFTGTTTQTLATDRETVGIVMVPSNDGATIVLPRIRKISIPGDFVFGQSGMITFFVESTANEPLSYTLTAAATGGGFQPATGTFTMPSTAGSFVVRYVPPFAVASPTEYTHELRVTNQAGHSVSTTFKTRVVPPDTAGDALGTTVRVVFNPVINNLEASRALGTSEVTWTASVADDKATEALTYAWSFTPSAPVTPLPSFTAQANPTVMQDYSVTLQGTLTLVVTDGDGGATTAKYLLGPNQFPDQPGQAGGATDLLQIAAGESHTCALLNDGSVRCWGNGASGRLGYGNTDNIGDNETPFSRGAIPLTEKVVQLATGGAHTCALVNTGFVRCWGNNQYGQLGYGNTNPIGDNEAVASVGHVNLGARALRITAGANHTCALLNTGKVRCWGYNNHGQLGYGHTNNVGDDEEPSSVDVQVGAPVQDIVAGDSHTCALLFSGKVRCWGYNGYAQLGLGAAGNSVGDTEHPSSSADVSLPAAAVQVTAGTNHSCALLDTGGLRCWGQGSSGQNGGGGAPSTNTTPVEVNLGADARALQVAAGDRHTCALLSTGLIKCWGYNGNGQLGYGHTTIQYLPPVNHTGLSGIPAYHLTTGANHTCALLTNGRALCWGQGANGRLGYGNQNNIGDDELPATQEGIPLLSP